ncbi:MULTISPECIES: aspartate dehydrogenase [Chelatococcus]|uniref:L-aspartate dehydrogenase n=1 Tax=Chelatococcus caeni TaxID=1348468 RepID=A0A840C1F7_9HYPH|nr:MULTISPECIES: aspartate dehydrogenase [Chelatococcus]ALA19918.1 aspartate dehydrogenase [Chelatococcus sp. CO-6]MBB4018643.1 aspartate dehydrogenase [Chelatococcus caeni]
MTRKPLRLTIVGWGAIARRVAGLLAERVPQDVTLVAVGVRETTAIGAGLPAGAALLRHPDALAAVAPDMVIEAAGRAAVGPWGEAALRSADTFVVSSTSAFCDTALHDRLIRIAEDRGSRIVIPPGALGGIDALSAAAALPLDEVVHTIVKPPAAWRGTAAEALVVLDRIESPTAIFTGSARAAADRFPQNANATVITALAGIGLDRTRVVLVADPQATGNSHRLAARGAFGTLEVTIENRALADNPKSSEMTALSLARLVENRVRTLAR